jgi:hypothetical protein
MSDINLTFINQSDDANNSQIVIFQKNVAMAQPEAIAWHVIQHCDPGESHELSVPADLTVRASDGYGNLSAHLPARPGHAFAVSTAEGGDTLRPAGLGGDSEAVEVANALLAKAIDAHIYRGGKLLATHLTIPPDGKVAFQFEPELWIGAVSQAEEGEALPEASLVDLTTRLSLKGVSSAEIVMTGGGAGPSDEPFAFTLRNVVKA